MATIVSSVRSVLPYLIVGIGCYSLVLIEIISDLIHGVAVYLQYGGSFRTIFEYGESLPIASDSRSVSAAGLSMLTIVFFLWRPQSKWQLMLPFVVTILLFLLPTLTQQEDIRTFIHSVDYLTECLAGSWCLVVAIPIPLILSLATKLRIANNDVLSAPHAKAGIWELLFVMLCMAICMSVTKRVIDEQLYWGSASEMFRREVVPSVAIGIGVSVVTLLVMLSLRSARGLSRWTFQMFAVLLLLASVFISTNITVSGTLLDLSAQAWGRERFDDLLKGSASLAVSLAVFLGTLTWAGFRLTSRSAPTQLRAAEATDPIAR